MDRKKILIFLFLFLSFTGISCQKGGSSSDIVVEVLPKNPLVITGATTITDPVTGDAEEITPPWFKFQVTVTNNNANSFVLTSLKYKSKAIDGTITKGELTPETCGLTTSYFSVIASGDSETINCVFYIYSLPSEEDQEFFLFNVTGQPTGWFGTSTEQEERYTGYFYFSAN